MGGSGRLKRRLQLRVNWLNGNTESGGEGSVTARHGVLWSQSLPVPLLSGSSGKSGSGGGDFLELHCDSVKCVCVCNWSFFCDVFSFVGCWFSINNDIRKGEYGKAKEVLSPDSKFFCIYIQILSVLKQPMGVERNEGGGGDD